MAQRTIAPGGGNWNSTATWVEGAVPTSSDHVVGDALSGNLTINVNTATVQYFDFTNYTGQLICQAARRFNFGGLSASTSIIGSGMTFNFVLDGAAGFQKASSLNINLQQIGTTEIPQFTQSLSGFITLLSDLYLGRLDIDGSGGHGIDGNTIYINNYCDITTLAAGTTLIKLTGPSNTLNVGTSAPIQIEIDTSGGTTTIVANGFRGRKLTHTSGTISNPLLRIFNPSNFPTDPTFKYDLVSGTTWNFEGTLSFGENTTMVLYQDTTFNEFLIGGNDGTAPYFDFILSGSSYNIDSLVVRNSISTNIIGNQFPLTLQIAPGTNINVSTLFEACGLSNFRQLVYPSITIESSVPATQAPLNINTYNQNLNNVALTDIDCSGGNTLYGLDLTLSNTANITNITLPLSVGGGGETTHISVS